MKKAKVLASASLSFLIMVLFQSGFPATADAGCVPGQVIMTIGAIPETFLTAWLPCDGSTLNRYQYEELFAALEYKYGGSGNEFALPDLRGRMLIGSGQGSGLTERVEGDIGGQENITSGTSGSGPQIQNSSDNGLEMDNMPPYFTVTYYICFTNATDY
jgi:hypothetical protein